MSNGCKVCGRKIPVTRKLTVSRWNGAECPQCKSYMQFSHKTYLFQDALSLGSFGVLWLMFSREMYWLGGLGLLLTVAASILVACYSELVPDPAHAHRVPKQ